MMRRLATLSGEQLEERGPELQDISTTPCVAGLGSKDWAR